MIIRINGVVIDIPEDAVVKVADDKIYVNGELVEGKPIERKEIRCGEYRSPNEPRSH